jgi:hypothetical protein
LLALSGAKTLGRKGQLLYTEPELVNV